MIRPGEPTFGTSEQAALDNIGLHLRAKGWAEHVTVAWLLRHWQELAASVDRYALTIDDYTNDLTSRDGLEIVLAKCEEPIRTKLAPYVNDADKEVLARTQEDAGGTVTRYSSID